MLLGKLSLCFDFQEKFPALLFSGARNPQLAGGAAGTLGRFGLIFLKHRVLYWRHFEFLKFCKKGKFTLGFEAVQALNWDGNQALVWWHLWEGHLVDGVVKSNSLDFFFPPSFVVLEL